MKLKKIYRAAKRGDLATVKYYLEHLEQRNVSLSVRETIGCIGVRDGNVNLLEYAVKGNPWIVDRVFRYAIEYGAVNATRYLVETHNANILKREYTKGHNSNFVSTVVDIAAERGHLSILKYFLEERNVNIDKIPTAKRRPLLFRALQHKRAHIVKYLIERKNANLTALDYEGQNILFTAAHNCDLNFIKYVLDEKKADIDLDRRNKAGKTLLLKVACWWHCFEILEYLVEQKHVKIVDGENGSPLHCVRSARACAYLVEHGADVNQTDVDGDTPLHRIIDRMNDDIDDERTVEEYVKICECLVERGADVNLRNKYGRTPLSLASYRPTDHNYKIAKCLVEHGANVTAKDVRGGTPLIKVVMGRSCHGPPTNTDLIEYLVEQGADVNEAGERMETALHRAAFNDDIQVCKYLVEKGADFNKRNSEGKTPLHIAATMNNYDICKYLVSKGASVKVKDVHGRLPVHMAFDQKLVEYLKSCATSEEPLQKRRTGSERTGEQSFKCPSCGAKFVRVERSVDVSAPSPKSISAYSSNVDHAIYNLPTSFKSTYFSHFESFLMLARLCIAKASSSLVYSLAADESRALWSPKMILESRMDPLAEDVVSANTSKMYQYLPTIN